MPGDGEEPVEVDAGLGRRGAAAGGTLTSSGATGVGMLTGDGAAAADDAAAALATCCIICSSAGCNSGEGACGAGTDWLTGLNSGGDW